MSGKRLFKIEKHSFGDGLLTEIRSDHFVKGFWPLIYILSDGNKKQAYVGETTDAMARMTAHLKSATKSKLKSVHLITSDKFNKSATLDIEANLIKYIAGDGQYELQNGNIGLANHTYYQKEEVYSDIFRTLWNELKPEGITKNTLEHINNSDLFKYSPYKTLSAEQQEGLINILKSLRDQNYESVIVEGGAGTGKTILAIYIFKLLHTLPEDFNYNEFGTGEEEVIQLVREIKDQYKNLQMGLVVPMSSFRSTLKKVFRNIKGLRADMVISPAEVAAKKFDILIVDESHRLRRRVNMGAYFGRFDQVNKILKLNKDTANELSWIIRQSKKRILFYDENQTIKPSDVIKNDFTRLKTRKATILQLKSQFRVKGGTDYVSYLDCLLNCSFSKRQQRPYVSDKYEFVLFDNLKQMREAIKKRDKEVGLSRLIAGYSWKWISKKNRSAYDIIIDGVKMKWNSVNNDWVNSENAINEVGCIHTTQGYDLNYAGIIFGNEISYDKSRHEIIINEEHYHDKNGKHSIKDPAELKAFIINIYKTIMLRGIKGTYIYVCDEALRAYFAECIAPYQKRQEGKIRKLYDEKPSVNSIPYYDISIAAGNFSNPVLPSDNKWIEVTNARYANDDYFVCRITGESMNRKIPNGSLCLFRKDNGGSRKDKIVLVEHHSIQDTDFVSGFTIKYYHSEKEYDQDGWKHASIILKPSSDNPDFKEIILQDDELSSLKVIGIFVRVLE